MPGCAITDFVSMAKGNSYYGYPNVKEYLNMCGTKEVPIPDEIFGSQRQLWLNEQV
jgi:hypothetical protein